MKLFKHDLEYKNRIVAGLITIIALLLFCILAGKYNETLPVVTLKVNSIEILQDEDVPQIQVEVACSTETKDIILDRKAAYTLESLLKDLNQGKGYQIQSQIDNTKEGVYFLELELDEELKEKFSGSWYGKIKYVIENGSVEVKNKYGSWEENKFLKLDGTYASGWMNMGSDTYYFDENGERVTGEQKISGNTYYFQEDGKFDQTKNKINPNRPMIALTFDDGPGKYTARLLETLEEYDARATFFMLGQKVGDYAEEIKKMVEIGCEIGNHTTNHARLTELSVKDIEKEVNKTNNELEKIIGQGASLVRPPFGAVNANVRKTVKTPLIMWSLDTLDWKRKNADSITKYVMKNVQDGDIILMHDIHEFSVDSAEDFIPQLIEQGYQLVTVSEMAQIRGSEFKNGEKYFNFYNK